MNSYHHTVGKAGQYLTVLAVTILLFSCEVTVDNDSNNHRDNRSDNQNYSASENFVFNASVNNQNTLRLQTINGQIEIHGIDSSSEVKVTGKREVKSDSYADAKEHLDYLQVDFQDNAENISILTIQPNESNGRNYIVDYYIEIPSNWMVSVDHVNGNLDITNINNSIDASLVNGKMQFDDIYANVDASIVNGTFDGNITIPSNGYCRINLVNGTIDLDIPATTSADFTANVVTGAIHLYGLNLENLHTSSIRTTGTLGAGEGQIDLETVNGPITVKGF